MAESSHSHAANLARSGGSVGSSHDIEKTLALHNEARRDASKRGGKGRPDLTWDTNLAHDAQNWANKIAAEGQMKHSQNSERPGQGENLAGGSGAPEYTFAWATQVWLDEVKHYDGRKYENGGDSSKYGHYTQAVWPTTERLGMGIAKSHNGWTYIVGRYAPAGNYIGVSAWY